MQVIEREVFKKDIVYNRVFRLLLASHKIADHTKKGFTENKFTDSSCRNFAQLAGRTPLYLHYDTFNWRKTNHIVSFRIDRICFYDDFLEYSTARMKGLNSTTLSEFPEQN